MTITEKLRIFELGLDGTLPTEIGSLTKLTELRLSHLNINGNIPSELGMLSNLSKLCHRA